MKNPFEVIIFDNKQSIPVNTVETLFTAGFRVRAVANYEELNVYLKTSDPYKVLLIDCGKSEQQTVELVKDLLRQELLFHYPLVVVGYQIDAFGNVLNRYFKIASGLSYPAQAKTVLEYIERACNRYKPVQQAAETNSAVYDLSEIDSSILQIEDNVAENIFKEVAKYNLFNFNIESQHYLYHVSRSDLIERTIISASTAYYEVIIDILDHAGDWGQIHLLRTAFLSCKFAQALQLNTKDLELINLATFLFCYSFVDKKRDLLRKPYHQSRNILIRKDLCSFIKDSAMKVALNFSDAELSNFLSIIAKLVGRESKAEDESCGIAAATFIMAELIDRVCFENDCWDARAAYNLIHRIKRKRFHDIPTAVLACSIKLLSDAITNSPCAASLPKGTYKQKELLKLANDIKNQNIDADEEKVAINELQPGMRLARALYSFDGKLLLNADVILDQDLVWRIWQLSAIRPLNGPAVVKK